MYWMCVRWNQCFRFLYGGSLVSVIFFGFVSFHFSTSGLFRRQVSSQCILFVGQSSWLRSASGMMEKRNTYKQISWKWNKVFGCWCTVLLESTCKITIIRIRIRCLKTTTEQRERERVSESGCRHRWITFMFIYWSAFSHKLHTCTQF